MDREFLKNIIKYPFSKKSRSYLEKYFDKKAAEKIRLIMTLLVKDEEEILEKNIRFHKEMGVDGFVVTSHNSKDKTDEILEKLKEEGIVLEIIYEKDPAYHQVKFVDRMIKIAKRKYKADWVINADADEFYYSKSLNLKNEIYTAQKAGCNVIDVESTRIFPEDKPDYLNNYYFVKNPFHEFEIEMLGTDNNVLRNYMDINRCPKAIHKTKGYRKIEMGNHDVKMFGKKRVTSSNIVLYHFIVRSYQAQIDKLKRYKESINLISEGFGGHTRNMIKLYEDGKLKEKFDKEYGEDIKNILIREGVLCIDKSLSNFLKYKGII